MFIDKKFDYYGTKSNLETHISTVADDGAMDQCFYSLFCLISFISETFKTSNLDIYQLITTLRINLLNIQLMSRIQPPSMWNYKQTIANVHLSLFFYFFSWRIAPSYITQRVVSSRSCQLYEGTTPPFLMVGMRTGPGCVEIRSGWVGGGCGEGMRVSSKLSRLYAPDLMCGVRETQVNILSPVFQGNSRLR